MANDKKDNDQMKSIEPVAELHVPQIITALHQNAVSKCKGALGDKFRIINSAIDDSGDNSVLMSSGQHIISVVPTEATAKNEDNVPKKVAVEALKTYVHWFVGPDLAKEVNDKTVKSLSEAPGNDNGKEQKLDESHHKPFMTFSHFMHEADDPLDSTDFGDDEQHEKTVDDSDPDFENAERRHDPNKKPEKNDDTKDDKGNKSEKEEKDDDIDDSKLGYYVTYDLKVEGMKKEAKIDDSMTSMGKSIKNFFKNFFDDIKITASGLFGGGDSFTVKDIKDNLRKTFGPIDPDELARNVEDRINKKFKGSTPHASVDVQDKRTLVADLGSFINGKQKQKIESADYSLKILIDQDDPKKDILNRGAIANIVQASITGLFKKFKNRVTADDVIYIPDYRDIHTNTEKLRALYQSVPSPNEIKQQIDKSRTVNDALGKIKKRLEKIARDKYRDEVERADACVLAFDSFYEQSKAASRVDELSNVYQGTKAFNDFFKSFIDAYSIKYKKTEQKALNESHMFVFSPAKMRDHLMQVMFESYLFEDNSSSSKIDSKRLAARCIGLVNKHDIFGYKISNKNLMCMSKDDIKKKLIDFDISKIDSNFGEFQNGVLICNKYDLLSESRFDDDFKHSIMSILFEEKDRKQNENDNKNTSNLNDEKQNKTIDANKIYNALKSVLSEFGVADIAEKVFTYKLKSLDADSSRKTEEEKDAEDTTEFGSSDELTEAKKPKKKLIDADMMKQIHGNLAKEVRKILKSNIQQNPPVGIGTKSDVVSFLRSYGFGSDDEYKKMKKRYALIAYIKRPSSKPVFDKKSKTKIKKKGTLGQENATVESMKNAFQNIASRFNGKIGNVIEFRGTPSNSRLNSSIFGIDSNRTLNYSHTDVPANASVFCASFDIDEHSSSSDVPSPESSPSSLVPDKKDEDVAYVLPFGKDVSIETTNDNKDIEINTDVKDVSRNDLYIVPMPGLKYEDPEYANQNLM